jgi:hypothetical protein
MTHDGRLSCYSLPSSSYPTLSFFQGHASIVKLLLEAGAPWNALDRKGNCAGDYAMNEGHQEAYEVLMDAGNFKFTSSSLILYRWGSGGEGVLLESLVQKFQKHGWAQTAPHTLRPDCHSPARLG